jgi:hypothetical protein
MYRTVFMVWILFCLFPAASQGIHYADIPGIQSTTEEWTAFNWGKEGWYESVIAKKIIRFWRSDGQPERFETRISKEFLLEIQEFLYNGSRLIGWVIKNGDGQVLQEATILQQADVWLVEAKNPSGSIIYSEQLSINPWGKIQNAVALGGNLTPNSQRVFGYNQNGQEIWRQARSPTGLLVWESTRHYETQDQFGLWTMCLENERYGSDRWSRPRYRIRRTIDYGSLTQIPSTAQYPADLTEQIGQEDTLAGANELALHGVANSISGGQIIKSALNFIENKKIVKGSCYDFVQAVYAAAGFKEGKQRQKIFKTNVKGPFADIALVQSGDWLYYHHTYSEVVEHSSIFVTWLDYESRAALVLDYPGGNRVEPGRYRVSDLYKLWGIHRPTGNGNMEQSTASAP